MNSCSITERSRTQYAISQVGAHPFQGTFTRDVSCLWYGCVLKVSRHRPTGMSLLCSAKWGQDVPGGLAGALIPTMGRLSTTCGWSEGLCALKGCPHLAGDLAIGWFLPLMVKGRNFLECQRRPGFTVSTSDSVMLLRMLWSAIGRLLIALTVHLYCRANSSYQFQLNNSMEERTPCSLLARGCLVNVGESRRPHVMRNSKVR